VSTCRRRSRQRCLRAWCRHDLPTDHGRLDDGDHHARRRRRPAGLHADQRGQDARAAAVEFAAFLTATYGVATTIEYLRVAAAGATIRISNPDPYTITYSTAGLAIYGGVDGVDAQFVWTGPSGAVAGWSALAARNPASHLSQPVKTTPGVRPAASVGAICAQPPGTSLHRVRAMSSAGDIDVAQLRNALGSGGESAHRRRLRCQ
jgi:hypothetical protein